MSRRLVRVPRAPITEQLAALCAALLTLAVEAGHARGWE